MMDYYRPLLEEGFRRAGGGKSFRDFEIQPNLSVVVTKDVKSALDRIKPGVALYVGGMGHKDKNFHYDMMVRRGYPEAAETIQELYLAGRKEEAAAAVPDDYCDEGALVGPLERIRERYAAWESSGATGLTVMCRRPEELELLADLTGSREQTSAA